MKKIQVLKYEEYEESYVKEDCIRICNIMRDRNFECSIEQAKLLWEMYSDSMCAGWMILNQNDSDLFDCLTPFFREK